MYLIRIFFLIGCLTIGNIAKRNKVAESFFKEEIVPDLIDSPPEKKAIVIFQPRVIVNLGNKLKPSEVQTPPFVTYPVGNKKAYYTLAFLDPDAPSRQNPFVKTFVHWLVGNIPGTQIHMGNTLTEFIGSAPPPDSGEHRYTFLVYKQLRKIQFNETKLTTANFEERKNFSLGGFVEKYNLGTPFAGNFYIAVHEN
ncbi:hypothetical protein RN001_005394 [Aquatica leii]|uniref:Uncharacterized protein n=1 Tax=Aquatica leii TaxID=1421715 RepID=A0AAN7SS21_9COLE|nr:hypothetical protein RN001_005394 [Aquatica leii]